jgi:hypothetical protein
MLPPGCSISDPSYSIRGAGHGRGCWHRWHAHTDGGTLSAWARGYRRLQDRDGACPALAPIPSPRKPELTPWLSPLGPTLLAPPRCHPTDPVYFVDVSDK